MGCNHPFPPARKIQPMIAAVAKTQVELILVGSKIANEPAMIKPLIIGRGDAIACTPIVMQVTAMSATTAAFMPSRPPRALGLWRIFPRNGLTIAINPNDGAKIEAVARIAQ